MDYLLDGVTSLVGFSLVPESDESSDNVSDESSDNDEDKESDEISIYLCSVLTRYCSLACSVADFADCWSSGNFCSLFIQASISDCFFCSSHSSCNFLISLSSIQASS